MMNTKKLTKIEFAALKITREEEDGLILERDKFDKIAAILDMPVEQRTRQHKRIISQHYFTLLFSGIYYGVDLIDKLQAPCLIDVEDKNFGTPLLYALSIKEFSIAAKLVEHTHQYINFVIRGNTALSYAALHSQIDLERKIIEKGGNIPGMEFLPGKTPSQVRNELIASFMQNKLSCDGIKISSPLESFLNFCRVDDVKTKFSFQELEVMCSKDKSFYGMIALAAYAHETRNTHAFFCDIKHRAIVGFARDKTIAFVDYVSKNIFCFYDTIFSIENMANLIHECAHLVIDLIYDNCYQPYGTPKDENEFLNIVALTEKRLLALIEHTHLVAPPWNISYMVSLFNSVYNDYATRQRPAELIVRVPELLVRLGIQEGRGLLREIFPELLDFYYQKVVPKMAFFITSVLLKIDLAGKSEHFLTIYRQMQMMCEDALDEERLKHRLIALSLEDISQLREVSIFLDYKVLTSILNKSLLEKEKQQQREQRIETNLSILNHLKLNPYNNILVCHNSRAYWKQFVKYGGGILYDGYLMPHTIAHILDAIKALTPDSGQETCAPDCQPAVLLETIHMASEKPSQSWASFFGRKNSAILRLQQEIRTMRRGEEKNDLGCLVMS